MAQKRSPSQTDRLVELEARVAALEEWLRALEQALQPKPPRSLAAQQQDALRILQEQSARRARARAPAARISEEQAAGDWIATAAHERRAFESKSEARETFQRETGVKISQRGWLRAWGSSAPPEWRHAGRKRSS